MTPKYFFSINDYTVYYVLNYKRTNLSAKFNQIVHWSCHYLKPLLLILLNQHFKSVGFIKIELLTEKNIIITIAQFRKIREKMPRKNALNFAILNI